MILATAADAAGFFAPRFKDAAGEVLAVAYLGADKKVRGSETFVGGLDDCPLPVRRIIGEALRLDAAGLVIAHNHPSGDPTPSAADLDATRALAAVTKAVGIHLHDHLIFAGGECRSLRGTGLL